MQHEAYKDLVDKWKKSMMIFLPSKVWSRQDSLKCLHLLCAELAFNFAGSLEKTDADQTLSRMPRPEEADQQGASNLLDLAHDTRQHKQAESRPAGNLPSGTAQLDEPLSPPAANSAETEAIEAQNNVAASLTPADDPVPANTTEEERTAPAVGEQFGIRLWYNQIASACILSYGNI